MSRKMAIKRLSASDLTLFQWHFEHLPAGNQKAINLNADVFSEQLFPGLAPGAYKVGLTLYGPGGAPPLSMTRKILKNRAYKNWRLDGETIDKEQRRFSSLRAGDVALIAFEGEREPEDLRIHFFANALEEDRHAHAAFTSVMDAGSRTMRALTVEELASIIDVGQIQDDSPVRSLLIDEDLIDVTLGVDEARQRFARRSNRKVDRETLMTAKSLGEATGELGESLVDLYLQSQVRNGQIRSYEWTSRANAIAPMDFEIVDAEGHSVAVEVKSTVGSFDRAFHISLAEVREAASGDMPYKIFRVYGASQEGARLRVSEDFSKVAQSILSGLQSLPRGVSPDSVSVRPEILGFEPELRLEPGE